MYTKDTLFSYRNGFSKISIEARRRCLEVDLRKYNWIPKDFEEVRGLILTKNKLVVMLKK